MTVFPTWKRARPLREESGGGGRERGGERVAVCACVSECACKRCVPFTSRPVSRSSIPHLPPSCRHPSVCPLHTPDTRCKCISAESRSHPFTASLLKKSAQPALCVCLLVRIHPFVVPVRSEPVQRLSSGRSRAHMNTCACVVCVRVRAT